MVCLRKLRYIIFRKYFVKINLNLRAFVLVNVVMNRSRVRIRSERIGPLGDNSRRQECDETDGFWCEITVIV